MSQLLSSKNFLILICILFLFTRLYKIAEIPASVYWDEASIGYNAYSIGKTGKDEWGDFLPIHFRAFGEFKLPVFIYTVAIFVKIFGLNEFSVRLPAALFSLGVVIITYLLAKKITNSTVIGLLSSLFITISPWYFIFSRTGYEATAGLMFYLVGIYLFLLITKRKVFLLISIISLILSVYSYNSFRLIVPLTIMFLVLLDLRSFLFIFKKTKLYLFFSLVLIIISVIPIYRLYAYDAGIARFQAVSELSLNSFVRNYLSHYSIDFLIQGDKNLRSQQSGFDQIYLPELILLPLGLLYIIGRKSKYSLIVVFLTLISPIPAAITKESPHALRAISLVPFFGILSAMGIIQLKEILKIRFIEPSMVIMMLLFFINYFTNFINTYPVQSSHDWQYGYKRIYIDFKDQFEKYNRVIVSDEYAQPYIFALFYLKYDPEKFQKSVVRNDVSDWGFSTVSKFDKFEFGKIEKLLKIGNISNSLIFASNTEKIPGLIPLTSIKFLDNTTAFWIYSL